MTTPEQDLEEEKGNVISNKGFIMSKNGGLVLLQHALNAVKKARDERTKEGQKAVKVVQLFFEDEVIPKRIELVLKEQAKQIRDFLLDSTSTTEEQLGLFERKFLQKKVKSE